jgi:2-isopropylmalate synthase
MSASGAPHVHRPSETHSHSHVGVSVSAGVPAAVDVYDTTLRDGSQQEGLSLTVDDKLRVAEQLDHLGVAWIEGGWPGANAKDTDFFRRAPEELHLRTARLAAFGMTRRAGARANEDEVLRHLLDAETEAVCIVGKAWDYHVLEALQTTLDEGVRMVADSVAYLRSQGRKVFYDAEHFFDGYKRNPEFSARVIRAAQEEGADAIVLCDTNGGTLPHEVEAVLAQVAPMLSTQIGVHFHNDGGCGVANTLAGVRLGATQVQGCVNGYGERAGNADLAAAIPNLSLKMGVRTIPPERLERLTAVSHHIAELVNISPHPQQPYVGTSAFTHKAGLHTSAILRSRDAYEHISPDAVGNGTRFVVSEMAGKSTLLLKAQELGLDLEGAALGDVLSSLKELEHRGYHFEAADGSLELLMRRSTGWKQDYFRLESFRVSTELRALTADGVLGEAGDVVTEATIKVWVGDERIVATAEGNGPVNALDGALRQAVGNRFPQLTRIHLTDYRVRVLDTNKGTGAVTRVLLDSTDGERNWATIGVSDNIIEASWAALVDSIVYGLLHTPAPSGEDHKS